MCTSEAIVDMQIIHGARYPDHFYTTSTVLNRYIPIIISFFSRSREISVGRVKSFTIFWQQMLLPRLWRWRTAHNWELLSSPDTLWMLLAGFVFKAWNTASEPRILGLLDLVWSSWFLQPERNFVNHLGNVTAINCAFAFYTRNISSCVCSVMVLFELVKCELPWEVPVV